MGTAHGPRSCKFPCLLVGGVRGDEDPHVLFRNGRPAPPVSASSIIESLSVSLIPFEFTGEALRRLAESEVVERPCGTRVGVHIALFDRRDFPWNPGASQSNRVSACTESSAKGKPGCYPSPTFPDPRTTETEDQR